MLDLVPSINCIGVLSVMIDDEINSKFKNFSIMKNNFKNNDSKMKNWKNSLMITLLCKKNTMLYK